MAATLASHPVPPGGESSAGETCRGMKVDYAKNDVLAIHLGHRRHDSETSSLSAPLSLALPAGQGLRARKDPRVISP